MKSTACLILVDQLLLLARFESQQKAIDIQEVSLDEIIEQVMQKKLGQIQMKNIKFKFQIKDLASVRSDAYLLYIILKISLSNAIKYTPWKNGRNNN